MESTADALPLSEMILKEEVGPDYYHKIRASFYGRSNGRQQLEGLIEQVAGDPVREATLCDLQDNRQRALEVLARSPEVAVAVALRGWLLIEEGRAAEAREVLEEGHKRHPDDAAIGALLVEAWAASGDLEQARNLLEMLDLAEDDALRHYLHGLLLERNGEYGRALAAYERAVELRPEETRFQFRLGFLHSLHGDEERALKCYEMCQRTIPVYTRALINLGILYEDAERYEDAITCYRMVLQANPRHKRAKLYAKDAEACLDMYYDREKEKERSRRKQLMQIPVTDFELSVRSRNCLAKMNIHTLGDLIQKTEAELLSYKNFGETSLAEIKKILAQKGFRLGQGLDEKPRSSLQSDEESSILTEPVSVLELSSRAQRCMDRLGIETLGDLVKRTELELISQRNFGVTSLNEVKKKLKDRGLGLAGG